jgi:hypothetical protein
MRWMLIVAMLVGCDPCSCEPSAEIKARAAELSSGFKSQAAENHSKTIAVIESTRQEIVSQNEQIIDTLTSMEAKLIVPKPQREEVIKSAEPQEAPRANLSQPIIPVAPSPAVRSSGPLKLSWNVEGNWQPSILETAKHLREDHGIIADGLTHQQMHDAHAAIHEGRGYAVKSKPVQMINRGSQCPGGRCPTPRRGLFGWRR